jgi:tripeptide aminopeptidase
LSTPFIFRRKHSMPVAPPRKRRAAAPRIARLKAVSKSEFDERKAIELVQELMAIPGKSRQEGRILAVISRKLRAAGVPADCLTVDNANRHSAGESGNLIVKLPGTRKLPRRMLMAHVDTVPICVGCKPFTDGDFIRSADPETGLGGDDRAGVAVVLTAYFELRRRKLPHPPLTLFFPVQEEIGLCGARYVSLSKLGKPTYAFNWDGGDAHLACIGATGDYGIQVTINGQASHAGAHPEEGVSAIAVASLAIAELTRDGWHGLIEKPEGRGTSNVGVIQGGEATNVVTPYVKLRAEVRSHDPQFRRRILDEYRQAFARAAEAVRSRDGQSGRVDFQAELQYESFRLDPESPAVKLAQAAIAQVGLRPELKISNGGLDANWMTAHGLPTVTLGCGQRDIHTVRENLHIPSYLNACRIALQLASGELG